MTLPLSALALPTVDDFEFQTAYESWALPAGERMGVVSADLGKRVGENGRIGVGFFDAVQGRRGGFVTLGVSGAAAFPVNHALHVENSFFVGAGSGNGGYQLAGGGLMLRGSVGVRYALGREDAVGWGVSRVIFPEGGTIYSTQYYLSYHHAFRALFAAGRPATSITLPLAKLPEDYEPGHYHGGILYRHMVMPAFSPRLDGSRQLGLEQAGVEWRNSLGEYAFMRAELAAALGDDSAGYMHILAGIGMEMPLREDLYADLAVNLGGGGGGGVSSGGGLLYLIDAGMRYRLGENWCLRGAVGRMAAPEGQLTGNSYTVSVNRAFGTASARDSAGSAHLTAWPLRMRMVRQTYHGAAPDWRSRPDAAVDNLGVQLDYVMTDALFLSVQGLMAYAGDAGAYGTGLAGVGYRWALPRGFALEGELLAGAAGGGGINVGSGEVSQYNLGASYQVNDTISIHLSVGKIRAPGAPFSARVLGLALGYHFNLFSGR